MPFALLLVALSPVSAHLAPDEGAGYLQISGIYPHLAAYNSPEDAPPDPGHRECGIGAVVPWAGRLWYITYPPHQRRGGLDKLYEVDTQLNRTVRPESVGGTHASRMIHRESNQLFIGPYAIDADRAVRAVDLSKLTGRMTATARHLTDPEDLVYYVDMEGTIYEVDVHSLAVTRLFDKPVPGWHGKGAYTGQGRLIVANNGEHASGERGYDSLLAGGPAEGEEDAGVLAEWDGETWRVVERRQFTDVTGPGGIQGSPSDESPVWAMGWDRRSVILKLLDGGAWSTFRLPKASHTFDPRHGWFTEWPRIREASPGRPMMVMHGSMFDFPAGFSAADTSGIRPIATHLRYIPDFCHWNGRLVLASDDASSMQNPMVGRPQSNLWFGDFEDLETFGPRAGWGGVWDGDRVEAGNVSDPFLVAGYDDRILHLASADGRPLSIAVERDRDGSGRWTAWKSLEFGSYRHAILPGDLDAEWLRLRVERGEGIVSAYFHMNSRRPEFPDDSSLFDGLADADQARSYAGGLIRPAGHDRSLQSLATMVDAAGAAGDPRYLEADLDEDARDLILTAPGEDRAEEVRRVAPIERPFELDDASIILRGHDGRRYRLPKGNPAFDAPFPTGWPRGIREAVSERYLANLHGTFYEIPRADYEGIDISRIKPVASHNKLIADFCTWRGLLVLSGARIDAGGDGHVFDGPDGLGLWFGSIDDLWSLGKPVGVGGPWEWSVVSAGEPSDPYLMTGFDRKRLELEHDGDEPVTFLLEIDFDHRDWRRLESIRVPPGDRVVFEFPGVFQAHWARLTADRDCRASATFVYE